MPARRNAAHRAARTGFGHKPSVYDANLVMYENLAAAAARRSFDARAGGEMTLCFGFDARERPRTKSMAPGISLRLNTAPHSKLGTKTERMRKRQPCGSSHSWSWQARNRLPMPQQYRLESRVSRASRSRISN